MSLAGDAPERERIMKSGNPYREVMKIAAAARKKAKECDYQIRDSEALTWVIQGIEPRQRPPKWNDKVVSRYEQNYLDETLCYIDDVEVRDAVEASFRDSKTSNNLSYTYKSIDDEPRKARVRVIVNMVWCNLTE